MKHIFRQEVTYQVRPHEDEATTKIWDTWNKGEKEEACRCALEEYMRYDTDEPEIEGVHFIIEELEWTPIERIG